MIKMCCLFKPNITGPASIQSLTSTKHQPSLPQIIKTAVWQYNTMYLFVIMFLKVQELWPLSLVTMGINANSVELQETK